MRKHGGTPSRRDRHVTPAAISPPVVARGRLVGGQQSGLAGCKSPALFKCGASSCLSQQQRQREPWGASPRPSAPTYLPTLAGHNPALLLKLFYFFMHGLFPKANCTNGLVSLSLSMRSWLEDTNPIGTPLVNVFFNLRPMITSFLAHAIFEPVVNQIPIMLAMWMLSIRLNYRRHTPIPCPENGNWIT